MDKEIWVAGYPSFFGGADTELSHQIDLWLKYNVKINLVPMFGCDPKIKEICDSQGVATYNYQPKIFKDKIVASWCNGEFLKELPKIMEQGKPRCVIWHNTMTWCFPLEKAAHQQGWIDYHGFVSNYQKGWIKPELDRIRPVNELEGYRPYFDINNKSQQIEFKYQAPDKFFGIGRISRDDGNKYSDDMWNIFYKVCTPRPKKIFILGYGQNAHMKTGPAPGAMHQHTPEVMNLRRHGMGNQQLQQDINNVLRLQGNWIQGFDWQAWQPNQVPVKQVYQLLHCIIHKTGGSRESYCRIVPEAYAYGVPMIVEDDYAFPDLVIDGVTGYRCKSSDEMSYRASELAFDEEKRKKMIFAARDYLVNEIASESTCWEPWKKMFKEQGME